MKLRYMIIGAGGVGGPVGAYLSKSGCGYHAYCTRKASCGPAGVRLDACIRRK